MADSTTSKYRAPALEKGLDILELLAKEREPLSLNQISVRLGRSVSELFRMVQVLEVRGYVEAARTGDGFILSDRLFALGLSRAPTKDLIEASLPLMRRFAARAGQSCHLAVATGEQMVVVARVEAPGDLGFSVRIGYRRALVSSSSGMALYAFQPERSRAEWKVRLSATVSGHEWIGFERRSRAARKRGFVRSESTAVAGILDLSAPVLQMGAPVAALTSPYVKTAWSRSVDDTVSDLLLTAREITAQLAGDDVPPPRQ